MRLTTIRRDGLEEAAVASPDGPIPVGELDGLAGGATDLITLLESGKFHELKGLYDRGKVEGRGVSAGRFERAPLYRRPRKIWGIGLNYVEHAGDLSETAPADEPASFMRPDTTVVGTGD